VASSSATNIEICRPVSIGDDQGVVVVKDAEDLHAVLALKGSEVWDVVTATDLEPNPGAAVGLHGALRDEPKRERDGQVAA
jgi:hypothetical protein